MPQKKPNQMPPGALSDAVGTHDESFQADDDETNEGRSERSKGEGTEKGDRAKTRANE